MIGFPKPHTKKLSGYEKLMQTYATRNKKIQDKCKAGVKVRRAKKLTTRAKLKRIKLPPLPKLIRKADTIFSLWIRERDKYLCFARNIPGEASKCKGAIQCCHLIKRSFKPTRYDETNCNAGCAHHNYNHDHGFNARPEIYTNWYIKQYGALPYSDLIDKSRLYKKWTREELHWIIQKYAEK